jgi:transposase
MRYLGIDVHQSISMVCVLDENGHKESQFTVRGRWPKLIEALARVPRPFAVCFEASTGYGFLYEALSRMAERVVVAHPGQLRLIFRSKRKNDRVDAEKLAKLLFLGEVPPVYVPNLEMREWRATINLRERLVSERTITKNRLRALLRTHGIEAPRSLWSRRGQNWLLAQSWPSEQAALRCELLADELVSHNTRIKRLEAHLGRIAASHPGVTLLRTIPGVGIRTAEAMVAWIDQAGRFATSKCIGSYFGLVPCQDTSAGKERLGHITQQGPALVRKLLVEAAWQAIRRSPEIRRTFERIQQADPKKRKKIALVATAHYLARVMLGMLRTGQGWNAALAA